MTQQVTVNEISEAEAGLPACQSMRAIMPTCQSTRAIMPQGREREQSNEYALLNLAEATNTGYA